MNDSHGKSQHPTRLVIDLPDMQCVDVAAAVHVLRCMTDAFDAYYQQAAERERQLDLQLDLFPDAHNIPF